MKRILLLMMVTLAGLAACGNESDSGEESKESAEESDNQNASQKTEESAQSEKKKKDETQEADASEIIDEAISEWGDTSSYESRQTFTISSGETQNVVRTITTQSEQSEVKVEVDNGSKVTTHYVIDGDHFTYEDGSINEKEKDLDTAGSTYGEIVKSLESFEEGDASKVDGGYEIQLPVESIDDLSGFIDEKALASLESANNLNGLITITLNDEYQYTGGKLTLTAEIEGSEINMISNLEFSRIGKIDVIEKPKNM